MAKKAIIRSRDPRTYPRRPVGLLALAMVGILALSACVLSRAAAPALVQEPVSQGPAGDGQSPVSTATPIPLASPTPAPTATPTPTHPLMIEVMRQQSYPGSPVTVEQRLEPGATYDRYIVSYQSEGNKIFGLLTIPRGQRPPTGWPVIIFNHGFIPPDIYRTTERYVAYQDVFANNGYLTFRSDYRGHGESEGIADGGYSSPAYTVDVLNGMAAITTLPDADPNRIGMWGHSMGGQITLRAMVVSDQIKAGVIWGGVVASYPDLLTYWRRGGSGQQTPTPDITRTRGRWRVELIDQYGYPEENPEFWAAISPNTYVSDLSGPIQLHHGAADTSVPPVLSELLMAEIQAAGMPVELYLWEDDDHDITSNFAPAMRRSVQFFDAHVKGAG